MAAFLFSAARDGSAREPGEAQGSPVVEHRNGPPSLPDAGAPKLALANIQLPRIEAALPPWRRNASIARVRVGQPAIAIVIDDLGGSARQVERVLALDPALTLSFLPNGAEAPLLAARARREGHEVLVHVPMEPNDPRMDPGKGALFVDDGAAELRRILAGHLDGFDGYVGVNNHMGSRFTRNREAMRTVLGELKARGLMFLDSKTTLGSQAPGLAEGLRLPLAERDVFIDAERVPAAIAFQLARLERLARERGIAVAIGHPHDMTLDALRAWLPAARARGLAVVPISHAALLRCDC
ncbi:MAG: divergent polysaccharide deacetylase family protein [Alphaproteobacteria bacterium]